MNNVIKKLALGAMMATAIGVSATTTFAQTDCDKTYEDFKAKNALKTIEDKKAALELAKKYVGDEKCKIPENEDIVKYLNNQITRLPKVITDMEDQVLYERFNKAVQGSNWADVFTSGKQITAKYPDTSLDVAIVMSSIGFDRAADKTPVDTFNADTINTAKWVIQQIEAGKTSEKYGAFGTYEYKTTAYPDGKNNTLGWMNYTIGYITYERLKNPKEALPYLYKATQINSATKEFPGIYKQIAEWYVTEFNRIGVEREAAVKANGDKDNEETLKMWALQLGYMERAIDSYSRAYKIASKDTTPAGKTYKDALYGRIKTLYGVRFDGKTDGMDAYISAQPTKQAFVDPLTPVTPVVLETTTTGAAGGAVESSSTANTTTTAKTTTAAPTTTKAATTPAKAGTKATTSTKKPNPKKK